jgi:hypothetical protein
LEFETRNSKRDLHYPHIIRGRSGHWIDDYDWFSRDDNGWVDRRRRNGRLNHRARRHLVERRKNGRGIAGPCKENRYNHHNSGELFLAHASSRNHFFSP